MKVLVVGGGALGGAILTGLKAAIGNLDDFAVLEPNPSDALLALGVDINPADLKGFSAVLMAVKPQIWRDVAAPLVPRLLQKVLVLSVMAGVKNNALSDVFGTPNVARIMPTTGVATTRGVASIFSDHEPSKQLALRLFEAIATTVVLEREDLIDVATAVSGSGPAYVYAFTQALTEAGIRKGLPEATAKTLAEATLISAAHLLDQSGQSPEFLINKVASKGGTTEAGLKVLRSENGINALVAATVSAAHNRAKEMG